MSGQFVLSFVVWVPVLLIGHSMWRRIRRGHCPLCADPKCPARPAAAHKEHNNDG